MRIIGSKEHVLELAPELLFDESKFRSGVPAKIFFPESQIDVQTILQDANEASIPVVFIGSQSGLTGGSVPVDNCYAISFSAMNKIISVEWTDGVPVLHCEPGVTLSTINSFLDTHEIWPYQVPGSDTLGNGQYFYPPDPTEMNAQLGGTVATNASGARSFRFKATRNHIDQISCALASGECISVTRGKHISKNGGFTIKSSKGRAISIPSLSYAMPPVKNASGYFSNSTMDLIDLFIGSEGTLAAFTSIGIRLTPVEVYISGLIFFPSPEKAFDFADFLRADPQIAALEYFDQSALSFINDNRDYCSKTLPEFPSGKLNAIYWELIENSTTPFEAKIDTWEKKLLECESSFDDSWSGIDKSEHRHLKQFRHLIPELINAIIAKNQLIYPSIRKISTDTALPADKFRKVYNEYLKIIEEKNLKYASFGHLGDYHLHINIIPSNEIELSKSKIAYKEIMDVTIKNKGTVSAEHGIGRIKKEYLRMMYRSDAIAQMQTIKKILDPKRTLNSENLF
jgi:D-lactate dehydrogenase (cytochrome)